MGTSIALREWSAVVDALGKGTQILMLRSYVPRYSPFLLYPTFSYYTSSINRPETFETKFQPKYLQFAVMSHEELPEANHEMLAAAGM